MFVLLLAFLTWGAISFAIVGMCIVAGRADTLQTTVESVQVAVPVAGYQTPSLRELVAA